MFNQTKKLFQHGNITELFNFYMSSIILMTFDEGENLKSLSLGKFSVNLFIKANCDFFATICSVEGFLWPLTKDSVTIRIAKRTFAIALPGLLYGLQFLDPCPEVDINTLEKIFMKFGHYKDLNNNGLGNSLDDNEPNLWNIIRHRIGLIVNEPLVKLGQFPGLSRFRVLPHNPCFLRASRMSEITKLITDSMVRLGTLTNTNICIRGTNPPEVVLHHDLAFASVNVFSCIVDAVELCCIYAFRLDHLLEDVETNIRASCHDIGFKVWNLNEDSFMSFMHRFAPFVEHEQVCFNGKNIRLRDFDKRIKEAVKMSSISNHEEDKENGNRRSKRERKKNSKYNDDYVMCEEGETSDEARKMSSISNHEEEDNENGNRKSKRERKKNSKYNNDYVMCEEGETSDEASDSSYLSKCRSGGKKPNKMKQK